MTIAWPAIWPIVRNAGLAERIVRSTAVSMSADREAAALLMITMICGRYQSTASTLRAAELQIPVCKK